MADIRYIGIYTDAIESIIDTCYDALKNEEIDVDLEDMVTEDLKEIGDWSDITNSIIGAYLNITSSLINDKHNNDKYATYYVNCHDSHLYVDGEEV